MAQYGTSFIVGTTALAIQFVIVYCLASYAFVTGNEAATSAVHHTINEFTE